MRHRFYAPELRRFLTRDPLGLDGGANLYAYALLNPLALIDPFGLCATSGYNSPSLRQGYNTGNGMTYDDRASLRATPSRGARAARAEATQALTLGSGLDPRSPVAEEFAFNNAVDILTAPGGYILGQVVDDAVRGVGHLVRGTSRGGGMADELTTLYHHTSGKAGLGINKTGVLEGSNTPGLWRPWKTGDVYLTTKPELNTLDRLLYGLSKAKTEAVVPVTLPSSEVVKRPFGIRIHRGPITLGPPQSF